MNVPVPDSQNPNANGFWRYCRNATTRQWLWTPAGDMTLERTRQLRQTKVSFGGYNRQGARLILTEGACGHGAVDGLIRELCLEQVFSFKPGMSFEIPSP